MLLRTSTVLVAALSANAAFAQSAIHTDVETAKKLAAETGRPILAIAGKKT